MKHILQGEKYILGRLIFYRKYSIVVFSGLLLVALVVVAMIPFASSDHLSHESASMTLLSCALAILILLVAATIYEVRVSKNALKVIENESKENFSIILDNLKSIFENRTGISNFYTEIYLYGEKRARSIDLSEATRRYVNDLLVRSKTIFDKITGDDCSVCIKLLDGTDNEFASSSTKITKTIRDPSSSAVRWSDEGETMHCSDNTAFDYIVHGVSRKYFYFNNNLYRSYMISEYNNTRSMWYKFYNATAVCAIKNPEKDSPNDIIGFLCVDNFGGGFDKNITFSIMKLLSTSLFYVFRNLALIEVSQSRKSPRVDIAAADEFGKGE